MAARAIVIYYRDAPPTPAIVTGQTKRRGLYAVGAHFGTDLRPEAERRPGAEPDALISFEFVEPTDEHRSIAERVGERRVVGPAR